MANNKEKPRYFCSDASYEEVIATLEKMYAHAQRDPTRYGAIRREINARLLAEWKELEETETKGD